jgi:hypothetical protein
MLVVLLRFDGVLRDALDFGLGDRCFAVIQRLENQLKGIEIGIAGRHAVSGGARCRRRKGMRGSAVEWQPEIRGTPAGKPLFPNV